jgi:hypothetical protein
VRETRKHPRYRVGGVIDLVYLAVASRILWYCNDGKVLPAMKLLRSVRFVKTSFRNGTEESVQYTLPWKLLVNPGGYAELEGTSSPFEVFPGSILEGWLGTSNPTLARGSRVSRSSRILNSLQTFVVCRSIVMTLERSVGPSMTAALG